MEIRAFDRRQQKRQGTLGALPFLRDFGKPDELNGLN
jgi:hypothetical protein